MGQPMGRDQTIGLIVVAIAIVGMVVVLSYVNSLFNELNGDGEENGEPPEYEVSEQVSYVADGDTFQLKNGSWIRMLCINTEETGQPYSFEATERLKHYLRLGNITLEADEEDKDAYGRYLRYVWVEDANGTMIHINLELVREGYAHAFIFENNQKYRDQFFAAEAEAMEVQRVLWQPSLYDVTIVHIQADEGDAGANGEYLVLRNNDDTTLNMTGWTIKDQSWHVYEIPPFHLDAGAELTLYTGDGEDNETSLFWNYASIYSSSSSSRAWNNDGEVAFVRDPTGLLADFYEYGDRVE